MENVKNEIIKPIVYVGILKEGRLLLVDYKTAPNPSKKGWWIPAPELAYGEDPQEKAQSVIADFGFNQASPQLHSVESFVLPGGWHLIYHYICHVQSEPKHHENIGAYLWVSPDELASMTDIAHGKWEIAVGNSYLR